METRNLGQALFGALLLNFIISNAAGLAVEEPHRHIASTEVDRDSALLRRWAYGYLRRIRSISSHRNESAASPRSRMVSYSVVRRPGPAKRDFQDHNPPRTAEELYKQYDPSVAVSTGVVLGGMLGFIVGRVVFRCAVKLTKRQLRKTKRFAKYFPERELPPLHIAQQIAREHGIALPESLISKLVRAGPEANLRRIADVAESPVAITTAAISPLVLEQEQYPPQSPSAGELLSLIRVNIIGATPSITPNVSHRALPTLVADQKPATVPKSAVIRNHSGVKLNKTDENGHVGARSVDRMKHDLVVTTATIEMQPLLLSTTTSTMTTPGGRNASFSGATRTLSSLSNNFFTGPRMSVEARLPDVHRPTVGGRITSSSSYCLSNGGGAVSAGVLERRKLMED